MSVEAELALKSDSEDINRSYQGPQDLFLEIIYRLHMGFALD